VSAIPSYSIYDFSITTSLQPRPWIRYPLPGAGLSSADGGEKTATTQAVDWMLKDARQSLQDANTELSTVQTAQSALNELSRWLARTKEIAVKDQDGTATEDEEEEFAALADDITQAVRTTIVNGASLLDDACGPVGVDVSSAANIELGDLPAETLRRIQVALRDVGNAQTRLGLRMTSLQQAVGQRTEQIESLQELSKAVSSVQEARALLNRTGEMIVQQTARAFLAHYRIGSDDAAGLLQAAA